MTILSAGRIRERLFAGPLRGRLVVTPILDLDEQISEGSGSLDVRLGFRFRGAKRSRQSESDLYSDNGMVELESYYCPPGEYFILHPRHFVLGQTLEYMAFPSDLAAYVVGRSTWGRQGLIIATAVGIHPGYRGILTLELTNLGEIPLKLYPCSPIAQLFIHTVDQTNIGMRDNSVYLGATKPENGRPKLGRVMDRILNLANSRQD